MAGTSASGLLDRTLITGADGMIGSYVDFGVRTTHKTLDVTDYETVRVFCHQEHPRLIIHSAAATNLAKCEADPDYAYRVNAIGTYNVALAARDIGAKLVYVSTSSVFDGSKEEPYSESDVPRPLSQYGHSKYLGELIVSSLSPANLIVRVTWVFGGGPQRDAKFVSKILKQLDRPVIRAVSDRRGSPTYGKDVIEAIKHLVQEGASGTYHIPNAGAATRADVAREIVAITGAPCRVEETSESEFKTPYPSGVNESMSSRVAFMRPWQEALREYIDREWPETIRY